MISPKYALTHYYFKQATFAKAPHVVNLYLDFNCPFSAKIYFKLEKVIPRLQKEAPGAFQFVFVNVVQPWHTNSVLLNEYSFAVAQLLKEKAPEQANTLYWEVCASLFGNKEKFFDNVTATRGRNELYQAINDVVFADVKLPFGEKEVYDKLYIQEETDLAKASNDGNATTVDIKYFTKYLRVVGAHVTPTISVDGIVENGVSSGNSEDELVATFKTHL